MKRLMGKRWLVVGGVCLTMALGAAVSLSALQGRSSQTRVNRPQTKLFRHAQTSAVLDYSASLSVQPLSEMDAKDHIVFRGQSRQGSLPFLITLRYETGLRLPARASKAQAIDVILDGANKALPERFSQFHKLSERRMSRRGHDAAEIIFTYSGPSGHTAKQRLLLLVKDENTALYLSGQAKEVDYDKLLSSTFNQLFDSLRFE